MSEHSKIVLCSQSAIPRWQCSDGSFEKKTILLELELQNGKHTYTSEPVDLGMFAGGKQIGAEISVCYHYMEEDGAIILCGSSYSGKENNTITLREYQTDNILAIYSNDCASVRNMSFNDKNLSEEALETVKSLLNEISDNLVAHAEEQGLLVYVRKDWKVDDPELEEKFQELKLVYKRGSFYEIYDPEKSYDAKCSIYSVSSVYGGDVTVRRGCKFYNVIGSSDDPKEAGRSWLEFWEYHSKKTCDGCESYVSGWCNVDSTDKRKNIIGGHIVFSKANQDLKKGMSKIGAILPICKRHNANPNKEMKAVRDTKAIWLNHYFQ